MKCHCSEPKKRKARCFGKYNVEICANCGREWNDTTYTKESFEDELAFGKTLKECLKDWMIVEIRNGEKYTICLPLDRLLRNDNCYLLLNKYNQNLIYSEFDSGLEEFNIVKVYGSKYGGGNSLIENEGTLLWERKANKIQKEIEEIRKNIEEQTSKLKGLESKL